MQLCRQLALDLSLAAHLMLTTSTIMLYVCSRPTACLTCTCISISMFAMVLFVSAQVQMCSRQATAELARTGLLLPVFYAHREAERRSCVVSISSSAGVIVTIMIVLVVTILETLIIITVCDGCCYTYHHHHHHLQASCELHFRQQRQRQECQPAGPAVLPGGQGSRHRPSHQGGPVHQDRLLTCHCSCLSVEHGARRLQSHSLWQHHHH